MRACGKLSKLLRRTSVSSKSYLPPKSCMPSRAKMMMKRKSSRSSEAMERMELSRDATRLLSDVQYLGEAGHGLGRSRPLSPVFVGSGWSWGKAQDGWEAEEGAAPGGKALESR